MGEGGLREGDYRSKRQKQRDGGEQDAGKAVFYMERHTLLLKNWAKARIISGSDKRR
jgi:hypothetical protein